jgi:putative ATP-dependent endonuclease of OLD family
MHIHKLIIKNFRLLSDVELSLEENTTVVVGRNNSGKTSLTEIFQRFLSGTSPTFKLEDFSLTAHEGFWNAFLTRRDGAENDAVRGHIPAIEVRLSISYSDNPDDLGPLADFVVDLDPDCTTATISLQCKLEDGKLEALLDEIEGADGTSLAARTAFFKVMKERVPKLFRSYVYAIDPGDESNMRQLEWPRIVSLLHSTFIGAQRTLDTTGQRPSDVLGRILEALFDAASLQSADPGDHQIAEALEIAVKEIESKLGGDFAANLQKLLPTFSLFGYPGLLDPHLTPETTLDVRRLLGNNTVLCCEGANGVNLPESYNGLGTRNLIYILLKILMAFKEANSRPVAPGVSLVFIEEPEAHLHPQMQEVLIRKLNELPRDLLAHLNSKGSWPVQFIVTTHSSHVANEAPFETVRYFLSVPTKDHGRVRMTRVKDLRTGLSAQPKPTLEFLHQYMTLTRCDLFFADKAILVEGPSERLLLPLMIEGFEKQQASSRKLSSEYISVVEVGGAYAHLFFDMLAFLELPTLVITDLDSAKPNENNRLVACRVSEGTHTTNACLTKWFDCKGASLSDLLNKKPEEKTVGTRRIAFQIPESDTAPCGRTFEPAFMLANPDLFDLLQLDPVQVEGAVWDKTGEISSKTLFALRFAIEERTWTVPRYILEGLEWLSGNTDGETAELQAVGDKTVPELHHA